MQPQILALCLAPEIRVFTNKEGAKRIVSQNQELAEKEHTEKYSVALFLSPLFRKKLVCTLKKLQSDV